MSDLGFSNIFPSGIPDISVNVPSINDILSSAVTPQDVNPSIPDITQVIPDLTISSTPPAFGGTPVSSSTGATDFNSILSELGSAATSLAPLAVLGTRTYASVLAAQQNPQAYALQQAGAGQAVVDPTTGQVTDGTTTGFSLASLLDFSTPYPYMLGAGAIILVLALKKKGRR